MHHGAKYPDIMHFPLLEMVSAFGRASPFLITVLSNSACSSGARFTRADYCIRAFSVFPAILAYSSISALASGAALFIFWYSRIAFLTAASMSLATSSFFMALKRLNAFFYCASTPLTVNSVSPVRFITLFNCAAAAASINLSITAFSPDRRSTPPASCGYLFFCGVFAALIETIESRSRSALKSSRPSSSL